MKLGVQLTYTAWASMQGRTPKEVPPAPTSGFGTVNVFVRWAFV